MLLDFNTYITESLVGEISPRNNTDMPNKTSEEAKKLGLKYIGFGRYEDKSKQIYVVQAGKLVPLSDDVESKDFIATTNDKKKIEYFKKNLGLVVQTGNELNAYYSQANYDDSEKMALDFFKKNPDIVNRYLYRGFDQNSVNASDDISNCIIGLDSMFQESGAPKDFKVYFGLTPNYNYKNVLVGSKYIFKGYLSTSLDHNIIVDSMLGVIGGVETSDKDSQETMVLLEIDITEGQQSIYAGGDNAEFEVLFPRGTRILVQDGPHMLDSSYIVDRENSINLAVFKCVIIDQ